MSFRLVPKSVTLSDLEWYDSPYFAFFAEFGSLRVHCVKVVKDILKLCATEM